MSSTPPENQANAAREVGSTRLEAAQLSVNKNGIALRRGSFFGLRQPIHPIPAVLLGVLCILICLGVWWFITRGEVVEERWISKLVLPSPSETFSSFPSLWNERAFAQNMLITLRRLVLGFGLAAIVGIPLGVLAGCFPPVQAFLTPLVLFGRNIPIAALIPLLFALFSFERQKVIFIFLACVAFIIADTASNVMAVGQQYIDTAYTLGAKRRHIIMKVLVPLALPAVFNSMRLLFGLAFGYIMLAESVKLGDEEGGIGYLILISQRRSLTEHIILIILIIPIVALAIDRLLYFVQRQLFPFRYGGLGLLKRLAEFIAQSWQGLKGMFFKPDPAFERMVTDQLNAIAAKDPKAMRNWSKASSRDPKTEWRP